MDRRAFLGALGLLAAPLAAEAQQAGKVYRVGYLSASSKETQEPVYQALLRGLSGRGWIEGQNLIVERRWAQGRNERLPALAAELVQRKVDVIVAVAEAASLAAKDATKSVPVVMLLVGDPVGAMKREQAEGVLVLVDSMFTIHRTRLAELAATRHLAAMYGIREGVVAGFLIAYGVNLVQYFEGGAALYVDKILKGARPGDLPVEQPTKFELVINLKTAKALGLTIPPSLLQRADQVIE